MNNKELLYICHYCIDYKTSSRKDMVRHFNRKNICKCNNPLNSYNDCKYLSLSKKYYFYFNFNNLFRSDFINIINYFTDIENHIREDYNTQFTNKIKKEIFDNSELIKINNNLNKNIDYDDEDDDSDEENNESLCTEFKKMYYNAEKKKYICDKCNTEYKSKRNLVKHLTKSNKCEYNLSIKNAIKKSKETSELILHKKEELKREEAKHMLNQNNIQNINQNIQNNINNINNSNQNNFSVALKDFVNDRYDISHISDSFYQKKDFFLYPNFLNMIMENEKNQNIFFSNNEAIIYTDNELNKMSSDKASYLILDKLSQSFDELLYKQDDEAREYYKFITKYYHVVKGHYKHDTIFKEYNVDKREFQYTANSRLFRSRDKYSNKIIGTINKFNGNIRKNMNISIQDIKDIPIMNPNIEDFASVKMRYRDLKNKD